MKKVSIYIYLLPLVFFIGLFQNNAESYGQTLLPMVRYDSIIMEHPNVITLNKDLASFTDFVVNTQLGIPYDENKYTPAEVLRQFYMSDNNLKRLYSDVQRLYYSDFRTVLDSSLIVLDYGLERLHSIDPTIKPVRLVYLYVSAFHENILVCGDIIGIALDRYLGENYPMYIDAMTSWKRQFSDPRRISIDAVKGYIMANHPIEEEKLFTMMDIIKYWAYVYNRLHQVFPQYNEQELFGFTDIQYRWIKQNINILYENAVAHNDTNTSNSSIINKYFNELPSDSQLPPQAPRLIGHYLSYWMSNNNKIK